MISVFNGHISQKKYVYQKNTSQVSIKLIESTMSKYIEWQTNSIINYVQIICAHQKKKKKKRMNTK